MRHPQDARFAEALCMTRFVVNFTSIFVLLQASFAISLPVSEIQALLNLRELLEYPSTLKSWSQNTDFCDLLPSAELTIVCEDGFVTHLQIVGDRASPRRLTNANVRSTSNAMLSTRFSSSSLLLELSQFTRLKVLQLSSLGLWGSLPSKIGRLLYLEVLNVSSNFLTGVLPNRLMFLQNLQILVLDDNLLNGSLPHRWSSLPGLYTLSMSGNKLEGQIPSEIFSLPNLRTLVLDNNLLSGVVPNSLSSAYGLQALSLAGNRLSGNLPDLRALTKLLALNVQNNRIGPQFPFLGGQLLYLSLGKNRLQGLIPKSVGELAQVQQLDVSSNFLTGVPPLSFFVLPNIEYLSVAGNRLSGSLPSNLTLSKSLKLLDISFNLFTGHVPSYFLSSASKGVIVRFQKNCFFTNSEPQNPISYCQTGALASDLRPHFSGRTSRRKRIALIAGIVGGVLGIFSAFIILVLMIVRRRNAGRLIDSPKAQLTVNKSVAVPSELLSNARYITQTLKLGALGLPQFRVFPAEELHRATDYFNESTIIGEGSRGKVYKGQFRDGSLVAIRRLTSEYRNSVKELTLRLDLLGTLRHQHLVSLLGYSVDNADEASSDGGEVCLVYEYVSNRTLRTVLAARGLDGFGWSPRLLAVIGAAKGVRFLHSGMVPGIFDNDIKAQSILLDQHMVAKLSDFGLLSGYDAIDANVESLHTSNGLLLTDKSIRKKQVEKIDIYNFGLILLEVILGKPPKMNDRGEPTQLELLVAEQGPNMEVIDPRIVGICTFESLSTVIEITAKCLSEDPASRPSMEDVLWNLQYALQVQDLSIGELNDEIADGFFPEPVDHDKVGRKGGVVKGKNSYEEVGKPSSPNADFFR